MGKLQTIRDIFAIVRDFLLIIFLIALIFAALAVYNFVSSIDPLMVLAALSMGSADIGFGAVKQEQLYEADTEIKATLQEIESKALAQDIAGVSQELDKLRGMLKEKGMSEAVTLVDEIKQKALQNDLPGAIEAYFRLKQMLGVK